MLGVSHDESRNPYVPVLAQNWTLNNKEKVKYLQELGWWRVSPQCSTAPAIKGRFTSALDCCYEAPKPPPDKSSHKDEGTAVAGKVKG